MSMLGFAISVAPRSTARARMNIRASYCLRSAEAAEGFSRRLAGRTLPVDGDEAEGAALHEVAAECFVMLVVECVADVDAEAEHVADAVVRGDVHHVVLRNRSHEDARRPVELLGPAIRDLRVELVAAVREAEVVLVL